MCAASLAIIERHWKKKKLDLEARKRGYMALVSDASALEARVAKANKALKGRLRELQQVFTVRSVRTCGQLFTRAHSCACVLSGEAVWQNWEGGRSGGCKCWDALFSPLPTPTLPCYTHNETSYPENGSSRYPGCVGLASW